MTTAALQQLSLWNDAEPGTDWRVRRSGRARRLSVRVFRDGGVEIVVPERTGPRQVEAFIARHRDWIDRQRRRATPLDATFPPQRIVLPAVRESWQCREVAVGPLLRETLVEDGIGELELCAARGATPLRRVLLAWLAARAEAAFAPQLEALAELLGCRYQRLQIRRQRTRWGSCSTRGTISLNSCLLFQRPEVVRYLLVHELAHLTHMNHSERFWGRVARFEPQWRELDRELTHGWSAVPGWMLASLRA